MGKKVLMLLDNPLISDQRVEKEASCLADAGFNVEIWCMTDPVLPEVQEQDGYTIKRKLSSQLLKPFDRSFNSLKASLALDIARSGASFLHCHDYFLLPIAAQAKELNPKLFLMYDSHEYLRGWPYYQESDKFMNRFKGWLVWLRLLSNERKGIRQANAILTPSSGISERIKEEHKLLIQPITVRNIPKEDNSQPANVHELLGIDEDKLIMVHTGNIYHKEHQIQALFKAIEEFPNLVLLFIGNRPRFYKIKATVKADQKLQKKIYFIDYDRSRLFAYLRGCQIGLAHTLSDHYLAHRIGSSNRIMEYTLSGLPVVATQQETHEMMNDEFGHLSLYNESNMETLSTAIRQMILELNQKEEKARIASVAFSWKREFQPVINLYRSIA